MVSRLLRTTLLVLAFELVEFHRAVLAAEPIVSTKPVGSEMSGDEFFERKVRPLFVQHCYSCHAKGQKKGGLSLADRAGLLAGGESGAVVALEKPDESLLIAAVEHRGGTEMPPNGKLSDGEIAALRKWIQLGLPWPESAANKAGGIRTSGSITDEDRQFWSFQPVKDVAPPAVKNAAWPRRPLDQFVMAQLEANGLTPVGEADKRTFIRRATFDLIGLPPTPEDVAAFMADDSPLAHERLINRLLESPHYGERWARHWLDVARYGEDQAHTFQARMYPSGYRYRDWVVAAFNADLPYNQFVIEQIAGDLLPDDGSVGWALSPSASASPQATARQPTEVPKPDGLRAHPTNINGRLERLPALGYLALGPVYYKDAGCAGKAESDEVDDRIDTLCRGFLGLTVSCARCHDHKFDPIPTQDYYALAGVFASTQYREAPLAPDDIVQQYDARAEVVKGQEKRLTEAQATEARKMGESFAPLTSKYVVAAWKLQHRGEQNANELTKRLADELGLQRFLIERWSQFLTSDLVQKRAYLAAYKSLMSLAAAGEKQQREVPVDAPADADAVVSVEAKVAWFGVALQEQLAAALKTRDEQDAAYAQRLAEAADSDKGKVEKPKLDAARAELLKDVLTDKNAAPLAIPKDRVDKLLPEASKAALAEIQKELDRAKQELGSKYPIAHSLADSQPTNVKVHLRGNHKELGDEVPRRFLAILSPQEPKAFQDGSGRLELARAIADPSNPLTARVMVNRVWQHHFGRGLVGTPSNFGLLGERPTHPELLDHLAARFVASGWSLKQLHREIMLSATYRLSSSAELGARSAERNADGSTLQSSSVPHSALPAPHSLDPDNRLLWRQNRRRLDIEAWRDSMLAVSGNLDATLGGAAVNLNDGGNRRRTLYAAISRHELNGTLRLFDFPDPNLTSERRVSTTVPMQQLFVLNSDFLVRQARSLSQRLANETASDDKGRIERAYSLLFQRPPKEAEVQIGLTYLQAPLPDKVPASDVKLTAWEQYAQALLGTNEFVFVD